MLLKITSSVAPSKLMDRFSGQRSFLRDARVSYWAPAGTESKRAAFQNFPFERIRRGLVCRLFLPARLFGWLLLPPKKVHTPVCGARRHVRPRRPASLPWTAPSPRLCPPGPARGTRHRLPAAKKYRYCHSTHRQSGCRGKSIEIHTA